MFWTFTLGSDIAFIAVSMVELIKQAIADNSKVGNMMSTYIDKKMMGKSPELLWVLYDYESTYSMIPN